MPEYQKQTDNRHEVSLNSSIQNARWGALKVCAGDEANLVVETNFVGHGSEADITVFNGQHQELGKLKGKVFGNIYTASFQAPLDADDYLYYEVALNQHGLKQMSTPIKVEPQVMVDNMKWSQNTACRGDELKLTADVTGLPEGAEVLVKIYEHDLEDAHDLVTKLQVQVNNSKIDVAWEFEYQDDTDDIPTEAEMQQTGQHYHAPEYFWTVNYLNKTFGENLESGLMRFKDTIQINITQHDDEANASLDYNVQLADNSSLQGKVGENGAIEIEDIVPGRYSITVTDSN